MSNDQKEILAEAIRIEVDDQTGDVFIVFKVKTEKFKREIKDKWVEDLEFRLINKKLVEK